jgi:Na+-translocating ferredoxin:NAD+ oxidoreductase subunit B
VIAPEVVPAVSSLTALGAGLGILLGLAGRYLRVEVGGLEAELQAMMPGSQCGQCGYPGCNAAASALASGSAKVTLCPPGGPALALALAAKLGVEADLSGMAQNTPMYAAVEEDICIGCCRCFKACPTDAIVGAVKQIHGVVRDACTGCGKCVDVCPTESLHLKPIPVTLQSWYWEKPRLAS